jgi:hypothetical protein
MEIAFLSPLAALVGLAFVTPVAALVVRERRYSAIRARLGLEPPRGRAHLPSLAAWTVTFGLLAGAAAQPVVRVESTVDQRTDAEVFVVIDITRSMLAARSPDEPKRIERAIEAAVELRRTLPDVPFGVATLTNRVLPHLFPSLDREQFELVVSRAIGVNRPPGTAKVLFAVSTDFTGLVAMATDNFFSPGATKRLAVLLSDGESSLFAPRLLAESLRKGGVELAVVRLWDPNERVWHSNGQAESAYRPIVATSAALSDLAALTAGGRVYGEDELDAAAKAIGAYLGEGPVVEVEAPGRTVSLAPYAVLAACIPLAFLLLTRFKPSLAGQRRLVYSMVSAWQGSSRTVSRSPATRAPSPRSSSAPRSSMGASSPGGD